MSNQVSSIGNDEVRIGHYVARRLSDDFSWGVGAIQPQTDFDSPEAERQLVDLVLQNLQPVAASEESYTSCTDGRVPERLLSGEPVPVREQLVGADIVTSLYIADALGSRFYQDPDAPVAERVRKVADFLRENGISPSSHIGCGAGTNFVTILEQEQQFAANPQYTARLQALLPEGIFDQELYDQLIAGVANRLRLGSYEGLSLQTFLDAVEQTSGNYAIAQLKDDGRGIHGHVEELIMRIKADGVAIDEAGVFRASGGREVFGVNDLRMEALAALFGRGRDEDYRLALIAAEDFANSGHGTLAKGLPTWIVTQI